MEASSFAIHRHGLNDEAYEALLEKQDGCCAICRLPVERLVIDHDHDCCAGPGAYSGPNCGLCVRGLLCVRCNNLLGYIESTDPAVLKRAFAYIAGHNPRGYRGRNLDPLRLKVGSQVA